MTAPIVHAAKVWHRTTGWVRWYAACPCGWRQDGLGRFEAEEEAQRHNDENTLRCICYDPPSMEYDPGAYPCDWCRARDLADIDRDGYDDHTETPRGAA